MGSNNLQEWREVISILCGPRERRQQEMNVAEVRERRQRMDNIEKRLMKLAGYQY